MTFLYTGGATARGNAINASLTHGLTINAGDLVVAYVNRNSTNSISADAGGVAWTEALNAAVTSETARHAFYWKIAGSSEPASYGWTFGTADHFQIILKVFTSTTTPLVDAPIIVNRQASTSVNMVCGAANGQTISANAVSLIFGGKDTRSAGGIWATVDNSYTGVLGETDNQDTAGAHRIYLSETTFSGNITFTDPGPSVNDNTYSVHISFVGPEEPSDGLTQPLTTDLTADLTTDLTG